MTIRYYAEREDLYNNKLYIDEKIYNIQTVE